jgi:hypothetical protein
MLGSEKFISWIKDRFFKQKKDKQVPMSKQLAPDLDTIISEVIRYYKVKRRLAPLFQLAAHCSNVGVTPICWRATDTS